jgi:hypothetical protein
VPVIRVLLAQQILLTPSIFVIGSRGLQVQRWEKKTKKRFADVAIGFADVSF